jgi:diguanylate cyclase (GGDEF)-like protein
MEHMLAMLRNSRDEISTKNRQLEILATQDALTGCLNRRALFEEFETLWRDAQQQDKPLACLMVDNDHFKSVNDEHGHDVGDRVLKELAREMRSVFRESDYIARWGGEEFLVALTSTNIAAATKVLERLRAQIAESSEFSIPSLTLSMGAAEWNAGVDLASALKQADVALYGAKGKGRNALVQAIEADGNHPESELPARHDALLNQASCIPNEGAAEIGSCSSDPGTPVPLSHP